MGWYLAPSLELLTDQIDDAVGLVGRPMPPYWTIGDAAHSSRYSQHNPNSRGSVNAVDIREDGEGASAILDMDALRDDFITQQDPRLWYVIHEGWIYSRTRNFRPKQYTGINAHNTHLHVSIVTQAWAEQSLDPWVLPSLNTGTQPIPDLPDPPQQEDPMAYTFIFEPDTSQTPSKLEGFGPARLVSHDGYGTTVTELPAGSLHSSLAGKLPKAYGNTADLKELLKDESKKDNREVKLV